MLIDTHCHVTDESFADDREEVLARAQAAGVGRIINVGFNRETIPPTLVLAEQHDWIYAAVGWHPVDAIHMKEEDWAWLTSCLAHPEVVALGEIGLDYHWDTSPKEVQQDLFRRQIRLAKELKLPIIIHNRDADEDVVQILREEKACEVGGVMHCFSGTWETASACLDMDFYISFGGPITFKNAKLPKKVLENVPLDRLLVETDCPYLAPHPNRGKRNEPSMVKLVAESAAQIKGVSMDEIMEITTANACRLFPIL